MARRRKRVRRMKRRNPIKRRRFGRKSAKRVAAGKKAARTRKRRKNARKSNPVKRRRVSRVVRRRRRRNSWPLQPRRHKKASRKGWGRRRRGVRGYRKPRTYRRKGVARFALWRNQGKAFWMSAGLAAVGGVLATILVAQAVKKMPAGVPAGIAKYAPAIVPVGLAFLLLKFAAPKVSASNKNLVHGLSLGLAIAGILAGASLILPADLKAKIGMSGYVRSMRGYTNVPMMASYAPNGLSGLGNGRTVKPYGLGLPLETRQYNDFQWQGVLSKSVFEN